MAPLLTHLVIGERVYPQVIQATQVIQTSQTTRTTQIAQSDPTSPLYGTFLLGCLLADVHGFSDLDRRQTHFASRLDGDGEDAFHKSCVNFFARDDALLRRPWDTLSRAERAFVAGYLCHLAADESWKTFSWHMLRTLEIASWSDLPLPGEVLLTAFSVLSAETFVDFPAVACALRRASLPDVLTHVPYEAFERMWGIIGGSMLDDRPLESYLHARLHGPLQRRDPGNAPGPRPVLGRSHRPDRAIRRRRTTDPDGSGAIRRDRAPTVDETSERRSP